MLAKKTQKRKFNREKYKVLSLHHKIKFWSADLGEEEGIYLVYVGEKNNYDYEIKIYDYRTKIYNANVSCFYSIDRSIICSRKWVGSNILLCAGSKPFGILYFFLATRF